MATILHKLKQFIKNHTIDLTLIICYVIYIIIIAIMLHMHILVPNFHEHFLAELPSSFQDIIMFLLPLLLGVSLIIIYLLVLLIYLLTMGIYLLSIGILVFSQLLLGCIGVIIYEINKHFLHKNLDTDTIAMLSTVVCLLIFIFVLICVFIATLI